MARTAVTDWGALPVALTVPEAARIVRIGVNAMYQLARSEGFPAVRVGGRIIVSRDGLRRWLNGGETTATANVIGNAGCAAMGGRTQAAAAASGDMIQRPAVQ